MLSAVNDYKFVEPQNIIIDGGLMPLRQGDAKKVLRGEDAAFLREAACRASYLVGIWWGTAQNPYIEYRQFYRPEIDDSAAGRKCGGICGNQILKSPLTNAVINLKDSVKWWSSGFLSSPVVFDTSAVPAYAYTLSETLGIPLQDPFPANPHTFFSRELRMSEIEAWENPLSALQHPAQRWIDTVNAQNTGADGWGAQITPTYLYDSHGDWTQSSGPSRRRYNLEAFFNQCQVYSGDWSVYNGDITTGWNPNSSTSWYVSLENPNYRGMAWTDIDGNAHQADPSIGKSLISHAANATQAILQFNVLEDYTVANSSSTTIRQKHVNKTVFYPLWATWDEGQERWGLDKTQMRDAARTCLQLTGTEFVTMSLLNVPTGGSGGGSTYITLQAIHGIYTMNDDLKIQQA